MKNFKIFFALLLVATMLSPTTAHAGGIPLSPCEKLHHLSPPIDGQKPSLLRTFYPCYDSIVSVGGKYFFFQGYPSAEVTSNLKEWRFNTQFYVLNDSDVWVNLGRAPEDPSVDNRGPCCSRQPITDDALYMVATTKGIFLGGQSDKHYIGKCKNNTWCKETKEYISLKIDSANHVSKIVLPAALGANKSPGFPLPSADGNTVYFYQPLVEVITNTKGSPVYSTATGKSVDPGAGNFYAMDLTTNKINLIPKISSPLASFSPTFLSIAKSPILTGFSKSKSSKSGSLVLYSPDGTLFPLDFKAIDVDNFGDFDSQWLQTKDGVAEKVQKRHSIIFHLSANQSRECKNVLFGTTLSSAIDNSNIYVADRYEVAGSRISNSVTIPFYLIKSDPNYLGQQPVVGMRNILTLNSDCSYSFNQLGSDTSANQKYLDDITHSIANTDNFDSTHKPGSYRDTEMNLAAPTGNVFDRILQVTFDAWSTSNPKVNVSVDCPLNQSSVQNIIGGAFFGKNLGSINIDLGALGASCAKDQDKIDGRFYISLHYVPKNLYTGPAPTPIQSTSSASTPSGQIQAAGVGDAKWPAKCPAVIDTAGGAQPKISGYKFDGSGGENFMRLVDGGSTAVTTPGNVVGCYADIAALSGTQGNAWHIGTINRDATGYYWQNAAGVRWGLTLSGTILVTDKSNPYYAKGHQFITY